MLGNIIRLYIHKQGSDFTLILTMTANKLIPVIVPIFGLLHLKSETYKLSIQNLVAIDIIKGSSYNVYQFQKNRNRKDRHIAQLSINHIYIYKVSLVQRGPVIITSCGFVIVTYPQYAAYGNQRSFPFHYQVSCWSEFSFVSRSTINLNRKPQRCLFRYDVGRFKWRHRRPFLINF